MTATRRSTESAFSSAFTKEVKKKDRPGSDWRWSTQWDVTTDFGSHIVSSPAGMFFPSRGPDFPKKIIFQKKRKKNERIFGSKNILPIFALAIGKQRVA